MFGVGMIAAICAWIVLASFLLLVNLTNPSKYFIFLGIIKIVSMGV